MVVTINNRVNTVERELKGTVGKNTEGRRMELQQEMKPWNFFM